MTIDDTPALFVLQLLRINNPRMLLLQLLILLPSYPRRRKRCVEVEMFVAEVEDDDEEVEEEAETVGDTNDVVKNQREARVLTAPLTNERENVDNIKTTRVEKDKARPKRS